MTCIDHLQHLACVDLIVIKACCIKLRSFVGIGVHNDYFLSFQRKFGEFHVIVMSCIENAYFTSYRLALVLYILPHMQTIIFFLIRIFKSQ